MKKVLLVSLLFFFVSSFYAQAQQLKIGFVRMNDVINQSVAGKRSKQILEKKFERVRVELKKKEQEILKLRDELNNALLLKEEVKRAKTNELIKLERNLQQESTQATQNIRLDERRYTETIFKEVKDVIDRISDKQNFDMIIEATLHSMILASKMQPLDITELVVKEYNAIQTIEK